MTGERAPSALAAVFERHVQREDVMGILRFNLPRIHKDGDMQRFALIDERLVEDTLFLRRTLGTPRLPQHRHPDLRQQRRLEWRREALREAFIAGGRPARLHGRMFTPNGSPPVLVGDEEYLYCGVMTQGRHEIALADTGKGSRAQRRKFIEQTSLWALSFTWPGRGMPWAWCR